LSFFFIATRCQCNSEVCFSHHTKCFTILSWKQDEEEINWKSRGKTRMERRQ
jgi:hypothetical protein